jgi:hypothetical protein
MRPKEFLRLLERDKHCLHCGSTGDDLIPQHRANRGFGGARPDSPYNRPSNLIVLCSEANFLMEFDAEFAARARMFGWKLSRWADPSVTPVWDGPKQVYVILGDDYSRIELHNYGKGLLLDT